MPIFKKDTSILNYLKNFSIVDANGFMKIDDLSLITGIMFLTCGLISWPSIIAVGCTFFAACHNANKHYQNQDALFIDAIKSLNKTNGEVDEMEVAQQCARLFTPSGQFFGYGDKASTISKVQSGMLGAVRYFEDSPKHHGKGCKCSHHKNFR